MGHQIFDLIFACHDIQSPKDMESSMMVQGFSQERERKEEESIVRLSCFPVSINLHEIYPFSRVGIVRFLLVSFCAY